LGRYQAVYVLEKHCLDNRLLLPDLTSLPLSAVDERLTHVALYQFYRNDELNPGDYSNWFAPNRKAIEEVCGRLGSSLNSWPVGRTG